MEQNYIFLDVDGVLNCEYTRVPQGEAYLDDVLMKRAKRLIDETDAKAILSSAWRTGWDVQEFPDEEPYNEPFFEALLKKCDEHGIRLEDKLGELRPRRSQAVREYLTLHPEIRCFVILDDWNDLDEYKDRMVQTSYKTGLTEADVEEAKQILIRQQKAFCGGSD